MIKELSWTKLFYFLLKKAILSLAYHANSLSYNGFLDTHLKKVFPSYSILILYIQLTNNWFYAIVIAICNWLLYGKKMTS